jgi:hypothetical protein
MTEREKELGRMAVIYAIANLDDVIEAFETEPGDQAVRQLSVDGCVIDAPTEEEMSSLLKHF